MRIIIALAVLLSIATSAFAMTDFACQSDCLRRGYMWGYCNSACSY